jgi:hypothetical protein
MTSHAPLRIKNDILIPYMKLWLAACAHTCPRDEDFETSSILKIRSEQCHNFDSNLTTTHSDQKMKHSIAASITLILSVEAGGAASRWANIRRRLSYEKIAGYAPGSQVGAFRSFVFLSIDLSIIWLPVCAPPLCITFLTVILSS